jgi:hypothetical protein
MTDPRHDPTAYSWLSYLWVIIMSIWGGAASYLAKLRRGEPRPFRILELFAEVTISGFVGIVTFFLCEWAGFNQLFTAAAVGVTAHMGSRALMLLEPAFMRVLRAVLGSKS